MPKKIILDEFEQNIENHVEKLVPIARMEKGIYKNQKAASLHVKIKNSTLCSDDFMENRNQPDHQYREDL